MIALVLCSCAQEGWWDDQTLRRKLKDRGNATKQAEAHKRRHERDKLAFYAAFGLAFTHV